MAEGTQLIVRPHAPPPVVSFEEKERMAETFAKSGLFGAKTKEQALALILIAEAEGIHPCQAIQEYDIIEGKPARKAERQLARFQLSGGKVKWLVMTDEEVRGHFSHPQGSDVEISWTYEQAQKIVYYTKDGYKPLTNKPNWRNYKRPMLRSRCISEGVRACFPGYALITLSTEEAEDLGVLSSEPAADAAFAQQAVEATPAPSGFLRGKAAKEFATRLVDAMNTCKTVEELDWQWAADERARTRLSHNIQYALSEHYEHRKEALEEAAYQEHVAQADPALASDGKPPAAKKQAENSFEDLKQALLLCIDAEGPDAALAQVVARMTPAVLELMSDNERTELQTVYRNVRASVRGG